MRQCALWMLVFVTVTVLPAHRTMAEIIAHTDSADPTTEGWTSAAGAGGVSVSAVMDDQGSGIDAWSVNDFSTADGSFLTYQFTPTAG